MRQAGIAVITLNKLSTVDDMCDNFLTIGKILGDEEYANAQQFVDYYKQGIADAQQRASKLSDSEKHTVLQLNVSGDQYVCADDKDISNAYYEAIGAKNVAAGFDGAQSGPVSWEMSHTLATRNTARVPEGCSGTGWELGKLNFTIYLMVRFHISLEES